MIVAIVIQVYCLLPINDAPTRQAMAAEALEDPEAPSASHHRASSSGCSLPEDDTISAVWSQDWTELSSSSSSCSNAQNNGREEIVQVDQVALTLAIFQRVASCRPNSQILPCFRKVLCERNHC